jgi:hypothetical protein
VRARVVFVGRSDADAGVRGSLFSLLEELLLESLIVGDVVRFDAMWWTRNVSSGVVCGEFGV